MEVLKEAIVGIIFGMVIFALLNINLQHSNVGAAATMPVRDSCTDSDGPNLGARGTIQGSQNGIRYRFQDECSADSESVREGYCNGASPEFIWVQCGNGCRNGICL